MLAVADGMGGYLGGEVASHCVLHRLQTTHWDGIRDAAIREALTRAADDLRDHAQRVPTLALMGATVAGALLDNDQLLHFNVGDSRIYRWRQGVLSQLSTDDRVSGSSRLTQALTASAPEPDPHLQTTRLQHDDRLLLCSDGLSDTVSNEEIGEALGMDPDRAADALLALALQRGASDNVSLVIARLSARST